jgi:hypothetical protein
MGIQPNYRNAFFVNEAETIVDCEIEHPAYGWIPYACNPDDGDQTIDNDYLFAQFAAKGDVAAYVAPTQSELDEAAAAGVRQVRSYKLTQEVDPLAGNSLRWADLTSDQRQDVTDYRQSLLDITEQGGFPQSVNWPIKPDWM